MLFMSERTTPRITAESPRASVLFALTVFAATGVQVLATPVSALVEGGGAWPFPLPEPVVLLLLLLGCAVQAVALAFSDRLPQVTVVVVVAVFIALATGLDVPTWLRGMHLVIALSLFLLATRSSTPIAFVWLAAAVVGSVTALMVWMLAEGTPWAIAFWWIVAEAISIAAPAAAGTILGIWWGAKTRRMQAARETAERARLEHDARVSAAQDAERARIAQELHDVAGQHLAGLITLADAALKISPDQPDRAIDLISEVRDEGRFAAASLAGALSDLRATSPDSASSVSDLRDIEDLLSYWRLRGVAIDYRSAGDLSSLPAVVSATSYRCVKEALTNAAKHAPGAPIDVTIAVDQDRLEVTVGNGAATDSAPIPGLGLGWGLRGIRERIELLQGTLSTQERPSGGWQLSFSIPTFAPN